MLLGSPVFVVLDTNVPVSALLKADSVPGRIVEAACDRRITPVVSHDIWREYIQVLSRARFGFGDRAHLLMERLARVMVHCSPLNDSSALARVRDPKDAPFYAAFASVRAAGNTAYLVTGNLKHFPPDDFIVSPRALLDKLEQGDTK